MNNSKTNRGFALLEDIDFYGSKFSIQKSSLATEDAIWFGIDNADPKIMASKAGELGIKTDEITGWIPYPISDDVLLNTRMHLNRDQVAKLIPILQNFVDTGDVSLESKT